MKRKVEGHPDLRKDSETGVIDIRGGNDRSAYRRAKAQSVAVNDSQAQISEMKEELKELSGLKDEMSEIKDLLKQLLRN